MKIDNLSLVFSKKDNKVKLIYHIPNEDKILKVEKTLGKFFLEILQITMT